MTLIYEHVNVILVVNCLKQHGKIYLKDETLTCYHKRINKIEGYIDPDICPTHK